VIVKVIFSGKFDPSSLVRRINEDGNPEYILTNVEKVVTLSKEEEGELEYDVPTGS